MRSILPLIMHGKTNHVFQCSGSGTPTFVSSPLAAGLLEECWHTQCVSRCTHISPSKSTHTGTEDLRESLFRCHTQYIYNKHYGPNESDSWKGRRIPPRFIWGEGGPSRLFGTSGTIRGMDGQHTTHVTSTLASHVVWCPRYRKKSMVGKLATFVAQGIRRICEARHWTSGAVTIQPDHVHLFLSAPPSVAPAEIAHQGKGPTARDIFQSFPHVKKSLWGGAFWSRLSSVGSVGERSGDTVLTSIECGQEEFIPLILV
jgi:putative transposase